MQDRKVRVGVVCGVDVKVMAGKGLGEFGSV